jgi:hypothetical protein
MQAKLPVGSKIKIFLALWIPYNSKEVRNVLQTYLSLNLPTTS